MVPRWVAALGVCALVPLTVPVGNASSLATSVTAPAPVDEGSSGWVLSTRDPAAAAAAPAYVGNGYVGTRVPAAGAGFASSPFATETHIAGVYADVPDLVHGGIQRQGSVNLPGWTQLDVTAGGATYAPDAAGLHPGPRPPHGRGDHAFGMGLGRETHRPALPGDPRPGPASGSGWSGCGSRRSGRAP